MSLIRVFVIGLAVVMSLGASLFTASGAQAAPIGTVALSPRTGSSTTPINLVTSALCPPGLNITAFVTGPGFPASGQNVTGNVTALSVTPQGATTMTVPVTMTMQQLADLESPPAPLKGTYVFTVRCHAALSAQSVGDFVGKVVFSSPAHFAGVTPLAPPKPVTTSNPTATPTTSVPAPTAPAATTQPTSTVAPSSTSGTNWLPYVLIGLAVVLVGGGAVIVWRK